MKCGALVCSLLAAVGMSASVEAQTQKFPFRLNWTLYGEHAPFFVARDKGFYRDEGLEVEIQEGSGSTTVSQLVAKASSPVAYVDAAPMMRGGGAPRGVGAVIVSVMRGTADRTRPAARRRRSSRRGPSR